MKDKGGFFILHPSSWTYPSIFILLPSSFSSPCSAISLSKIRKNRANGRKTPRAD